jgi:hypothetical protein
MTLRGCKGNLRPDFSVKFVWIHFGFLFLLTTIVPRVTHGTVKSLHCEWKRKNPTTARFCRHGIEFQGQLLFRSRANINSHPGQLYFRPQQSTVKLCPFVTPP